LSLFQGYQFLWSKIHRAKDLTHPISWTSDLRCRASEHFNICLVAYLFYPLPRDMQDD